MYVIKRVLVLLLMVSTTLLWAEGFRISDIRVEGLQRISAGTVFAALPVNVGDTVDPNHLQDLTRELFKTGYFDDIQIGYDEGVLVVKVVERPTVAEINIAGNEAIKSEDLMEALKKAGLSEGQIYKPSTLEALSGELERQYIAQGRYGAKVKTEVSELPRNRVGLAINVDEGKVARIKAIKIIGNKTFTTEELKESFEQETTGLLSWMNKRDRYSREKLTGDIERLRSYYMDRGYLRFNIESTQVSLSEDKESIYITLNISEGDIYTVSSTELAGEMIVPEEDLRLLVLVKEAEAFSQIAMTATAELMTKRLGNEGYTFADVKGIPERDDTNHTVKVTFYVNPGDRAYVRRINFRGNTKTADDVLRREMRQMESSAANGTKIEQSKTRLERLAYFKEVKVETTEVPGTSDQVDVEYIVEEQSSGSIGASVGFAQGSGLILGGSIQQENFLGTGKQVAVNLSTSDYADQISFTYLDPYYTVDGVSRGFNVYYTTRDLEEVNVADYSVDNYGVDMTFSYPVSEIERIGFGVGYVHTDISVGSLAAQEISGSPGEADLDKDFINESQVDACEEDSNECKPGTRLTSDMDDEYDPAYEGFLDKHGNSFDDIKLTASWNQSTLNKGRLATRGYAQSISGEMTFPGISDLEYWKAVYKGQFFKPINQDFTWRFRGRFGYGESYGGTEELPFFENFYGGGFGSVRGYKRNTLGPRGTPALGYRRVEDPDGNGLLRQQKWRTRDQAKSVMMTQ
jgi:outer membrane protein insertion porin family